MLNTDRKKILNLLIWLYRNVYRFLVISIVEISRKKEVTFHKKKLKDMKKKKKSVLFIVDDYHVGGVTSFIKQYTQTLTENNYGVIILGMAGDLTNPETCFPDCKVIVIPGRLSYSFFGRFVNSLQYLYYISLLYSRLSTISTVHFGTTLSTIYCLLHPLTWKKNRVITFYGAYDLERKSKGEKNKFKELMRKYLQYIALKSSNKIITLSKYAKKIILDNFSTEFESKINVIPGFVKVNLLKKYKSKTGSSIKIVNFGRAEPRKGIDLLLDVSKKLTDNKYKTKTTIASPTIYLYENFDLLTQYENLNLFTVVNFIHRIDERQKEYLLKEADLFVIPSRELETFGLTILEALSNGVLVVGTPVGAIPEILSKIDKRLISKDISSQSIYDTIVWFINLSNKEKNELQKKALSVIIKDFSTKKYGKKLLSVYK